MLTAALLVIALECSIAEPIVAIYDSGHPFGNGQCSEGPKAYMENCAWPSDFFTYITMRVPTIGDDGVTCASMGFQLIDTDPIFTQFKQYWMGENPADAKANFANFMSKDEFNIKGHPEIMQFLSCTRDHNPACTMPPPPSSRVTIEVPHAASLYVEEGTPGAYIDKCADGTRKSDQCADGEYNYLVQCAKPSDYFAYMQARCPTVVMNKTCADLEYDKVMPDPIFDFDIYWKGGQKAFDKVSGLQVQ
jgi:hypothetical protein